mgnify:CR=1 FL=1
MSDTLLLAGKQPIPVGNYLENCQCGACKHQLHKQKESQPLCERVWACIIQFNLFARPRNKLNNVHERV